MADSEPGGTSDIEDLAEKDGKIRRSGGGFEEKRQGEGGISALRRSDGGCKKEPRSRQRLPGATGLGSSKRARWRSGGSPPLLSFTPPDLGEGEEGNGGGSATAATTVEEGSDGNPPILSFTTPYLAGGDERNSGGGDNGNNRSRRRRRQ
uniref:DUF834 domain-containing protein n=1 Tax=Oryza meridionalis TaxID=40149 RepID=A0A0E0F4R1_9ORYZ